MAAAIVSPSLKAVAAFAQDEPSFDSLCSADVKALKTHVRVSSAVTGELRKISPDYVTVAQLKEVDLTYCPPNRLRMESKIGLMIVNGDKRYFRVPQLGLKRTDNGGEETNRRFSLLDLGVLSLTARQSVTAKSVPKPTNSTQEGLQFEITIPMVASLKYTVWIDPKTRTLTKREWRDETGKLKATFVYSEPKEIAPNVWMPQKMEILNPEGAKAGLLEHREMIVNQAVEDASFQITP
jgi:outer membrane lipoprotein-sorting protein